MRRVADQVKQNRGSPSKQPAPRDHAHAGGQSDAGALQETIVRADDSKIRGPAMEDAKVLSSKLENESLKEVGASMEDAYPFSGMTTATSTCTSTHQNVKRFRTLVKQVSAVDN